MKSGVNKVIVVLFALLILSGCATRDLANDYGLVGLNSNDAVITATKTMSEGSRREKIGASRFLKRASLNGEQADILMTQYKLTSDKYAKIQIAQILMEQGFAKQAYPVLTSGLNHLDGTIRHLSANYLGQLGCDAKSALPMLNVISMNDRRSIQEQAKIAIRRISLDCMAKKIDIK